MNAKFGSWFGAKPDGQTDASAGNGLPPMPKLNEEVARMDNGSTTTAANAAPGKDALPQVHWDDRRMLSSYANVVNATTTREEVTLFFGTNRTWNASGNRPVVIELTNRIMLTPHAAKRLLVLLTAIVAEYERRFGKIDIGARSKATPPPMPPVSPAGAPKL